MRKIYSTKITNYIDGLGCDAVFIAKDFLDIAEYESVRKALNRLADSGKIQKIMQGVYYRPRFSELLQEYEAPSPHQVALAIARKFNWNIAPSGTTALNMLGLSTQVSAKWSYISDGPYANYEIGNITLEFKRRNNKEITGMSYKTALIIQALKALGKERVDSFALEKIKRNLSEKEMQTLLEEAKPAPAWIYQSIGLVCGGN